jgi:hypothetical protein
MEDPMALGRMIAVAALGSMAFSAGAQVYRCADARGAITFQERACPVTSEEHVTTIPTSYPEVNLRERERLLARADAADERLLKRMQIESQERIARDHRASMEAIANAERERARADEAGGYVVYGNPLVRGYRPHAVQHAQQGRPSSFPNLTTIVLGR